MRWTWIDIAGPILSKKRDKILMPFLVVVRRVLISHHATARVNKRLDICFLATTSFTPIQLIQSCPPWKYKQRKIKLVHEEKAQGKIVNKFYKEQSQPS